MVSTSQPATKFVYVMSAGADLQKIGYARHPARRLAHIRSASPDEVVLTFTLEVSERDARAVERHAHWILREQRQRGEWFNVSSQTAIAAVEAANRAVVDGVAWAQRHQVSPTRHKAAVSPIVTLLRLGAITHAQAEAAATYQWAVRRVLEGRKGRSVASLKNNPESEIDIRRWIARLNAEIDARLGRDARAILQAVAVEGHAVSSRALKGVAIERIKDRLSQALDVVLEQPSPQDLAFSRKADTT